MTVKRKERGGVGEWKLHVSKVIVLLLWFSGGSGW